MTWTKLHDGAPHHPKLIRAGAEAAWLWASGLMYSNAHHLDGLLAKDLVPSLYTPLARKAKALAARLVLVGLWHDRGDYYEIHDYSDYQEAALKETFEARREYERERKREQRLKHRQLPAGEQLRLLGPGVPDNVPDNVPDKSPGTNGAVPRVTRAHPVPSRPDPAEREDSHARHADLEPEPAPLAELDDDMFARRVAVRFTKLFEKRFKDFPSMAGKQVGSFPSRLQRTARLRGVDPFALIDLAFARWIEKPLEPIAKRAPYACFVARFGELIDSEKAVATDRDRLLEQQEAALKAGDHERYRHLVAEYRNKFGGNADGPFTSV